MIKREIPYKYNEFKDYTVGDMLKYIRNAENKFGYLYDIFSYKFDMEYNTEAKRRELYNRLSLASLSEFTDTYIFTDSKLHIELEEIWINKSLEQYKDVIEFTEQLLSSNDNTRYWTLARLDNLHKQGRINVNEYNLCTRMTQILQTILATNMMHMKFNSFDECDIAVSFMDFARRETKGVYIPRLLKLSDDKVMQLINKYNRLHEQLMEIID